jgi:hypothetical protein
MASIDQTPNVREEMEEKAKEQSIALKAEGNALFSAQDYDNAIKKYSAAINAIKNVNFAAEDKDFLKALYSNRSASFLKLKQSSPALNDANECVRLDNNWAKGHVRKGDCYFAIHKYTEAYNAYNGGSRVDPNDQNIKKKMEQCMNAISRASDAASSSARTNTSATSAVVPDAQGILGKVQKYSRMGLIASAFMYCIPFLGSSFSQMCWMSLCILSIALKIILLYNKYGMIKFNIDYIQSLLPDPNAMLLFLSFLMLVTRPQLLGGAPLLFPELSFYLPQLFEFARLRMPEMETQIMPMIKQYAPQMAGQNLASFFTPQSCKQVAGQIQFASAQCEVMQGILFITSLFLPSRNFVIVYIYWQYLQMRYMFDKSGNIKNAFLGLDRSISPLLGHRLCPQVVRSGYGYLKTWMASQVIPNTAGSAAQGSFISRTLGSLKSKCNIM